jgi:iron(III) transport system substrate-binding protein
MSRARAGLAWLTAAALIASGLISPAAAADTLNAYSIWPENWARPMLQEFEQATGIKVNSCASPRARR